MIDRAVTIQERIDCEISNLRLERDRVVVLNNELRDRGVGIAVLLLDAAVLRLAAARDCLAHIEKEGNSDE